MYSDGKSGDRDTTVWHGATETGPWMMDKSKTARHDCRPCRYLILCRGFFGFVHHSIAILYHQVPNLSITIRNFFIAVGCAVHDAWSMHGAGGGEACLPPTQNSVRGQLSETHPLNSAFSGRGGVLHLLHLHPPLVALTITRRTPGGWRRHRRLGRADCRGNAGGGHGRLP
jgi:hypothetical protein